MLITLLAFILHNSSFLLSASTPPAWWTTFGVLDPQAAADDYAAVNQGQAKHIAGKARDYFNLTLPGGAGATIDDLVGDWENPAAGTDDYLVINQGQIKALAAPFYDRLITVQYTTSYPWTSVPTDDDNFALANIGQLKQLFSFDLSAPAGQLPDWWQKYFFGQTGIDPNGDADFDDITNLEEFLQGTNPTVNEPPIITLIEPSSALPQ